MTDWHDYKHNLSANLVLLEAILVKSVKLSRRHRDNFSCPFINSFTRQNVRCKQALVSSSCGKEAGDFAFYVAKLIDIRHAKRCDMNVDDEYEGLKNKTTFKIYLHENGSEGENFLGCLLFFL